MKYDREAALSRIPVFVESRRKQLGISQRDLAAAVGASAPAVCQFESGMLKPPNIEKLMRYAEALNCQVEDMLRPRPELDELDAMRDRVLKAVGM